MYVYGIISYKYEILITLCKLILIRHNISMIVCLLFCTKKDEKAKKNV